MIFLQTKRKTAIIVLVTILFTSLFAGSAIALREAPTDPISKILQILLGIQPQISKIQSDLGQINSTLNGLTSSSAQALVVQETITLTPLQNPRIVLLPQVEGIVYTGHATLAIYTDDVDFDVVVEQRLWNNFLYLGSGYSEPPNLYDYVIETDFSCSEMVLNAAHWGDYDNEPSTVWVSGIITYTNVTITP